MDALWHFRYRWQKRPHLLHSLAVAPDPDPGRITSAAAVEVTGAAPAPARPDVARTSARWEDPTERGATIVKILDLDTHGGGGDDAVPALAEWQVDAGTPAEGSRLVAVVRGFTLTVPEEAGGVPVSRLALWAGIPDAEGRFGAGVLLSARDPLEIEASLSLTVLSVPAGALAVAAPDTAEQLSGGIEPLHRPLAASITDDPQARIRPLGFAAIEWDLAGGRPIGRRTARRLRDLGVTLSGLVVRWHLSPSGYLSRPALVGASATVPCIRVM